MNLILIRKSYQLLLEVLIAMGLTVVVLMTLTFFYRQVEYLNTKSDQLQKETFKTRYLENRLSKILPKTISEFHEKDDFVFFTDNNANGLISPGSTSLVFIFDNGTVLDKNFSNNVLARLYVDKNERLWLAMWPSPDRWQENVRPPIKKELLAEKVSSLAFAFFIAPDKARKGEKKNETQENDAQKIEPEPKGGWTQQWNPEFKELPQMIRLEIGWNNKSAEEKTDFIYPLPNSPKTIVYDR